MQDLIIQILISSLFICGLWAICSEGKLFGGASDWIFKKLPEWLADVLLLCPTCMASLHGAYLYWLVIPTMIKDPGSNPGIVEYIVYTLCLAGLNTILSKHIG